MRRNVLLLALCQALLMTAGSGFITSATLVGQSLASDAVYASLPVGLKFLANMLFTFPASLLMKRTGRRTGFLLGASAGILGGGLCSYAILNGSFVLFCVGAFCIGVSNSFGQFYRFAAADAASEDYRSRAISYVMAGGVIAAFSGPNLAVFSRDLLPVSFAGFYAAVVGVMLVSATLISLLTIPPPPANERAAGGRPLGEIARQPSFIVAVLGGIISYAVMNLLMTATPLAMDTYDHPFESTALVIQWHVVGMFAPSFFTGHLIRYFGVLTVMATGALLLLGCVMVNLSGVALEHFWSALVLLGVGWNFLFVGGTTLLTDTYTPPEKAKTQALNDFLVFGTVTCTAFASGALHSLYGWRALNLGVLPAIGVALLAVGLLALRRRQVAVPAGA